MNGEFRVLEAKRQSMDTTNGLLAIIAVELAVLVLYALSH